MKIVLFIGNPSPPLIYFVNKINERFKVDLVVVQEHHIESPKKWNAPKFSLKNAWGTFIFTFRNKKNFLLTAQHYRHRWGQKHKEKSTKIQEEKQVSEDISRKEADLLATTRSQASATEAPAPAAMPFTAAMVGTRRFCRRRTSGL